MLIRNTSARYGLIAATLHWLFVAAFIAQYVLSNLMESAVPGPDKWALYGWHKSIGMTILIFAAIRLGWKLANTSPSHGFMPKLERWAAHAGHFALYVIIFGFPISGYLMSIGGGHEVVMYNAWHVPALMDPNQQIANIAKFMHFTIFTKGVYVVVGIHILAALRHHFILKDNTLRRILPVRLK